MANDVAGARLGPSRRPAFGDKKGLVGGVADDAVARQSVGEVGDRLEGQEWLVRQSMFDRDRVVRTICCGQGRYVELEKPSSAPGRPGCLRHVRLLQGGSDPLATQIDFTYCK